MEKYKIIKDIHKKEIKEGISEYKEKEKEDRIEIAEKIASSLYDNFGNLVSEDFLKERFEKIPKVIKNEVFNLLFEKDPEKALGVIDLFGVLPDKFQDNIVDYVKKGQDISNWVFEKIIKSFDKITNKELSNIARDNRELNFNFFSKNKEKFPYLTEREILGKAYWSDFYDWAMVIPYIDKFPSVKIEDAIEGTLKQHVNNDPKVLFKNIDKLNIFQEDLINIFIKKKVFSGLCQSLEYIDSKYHQGIAEKTIDAQCYAYVMDYARDFRDVDIPSIFSRIANILSGKEEAITNILVKKLPATSLAWVNNAPDEIINMAMEKDPERVVKSYEIFKERVDVEKLRENLFKRGSFSSIICYHDVLGIDLTEDVAFKIINMGGGRVVINYLNKFSNLSRELFIKLVDKFPSEVSLYASEFKGIAREDIYEFVEKYKDFNIENVIYKYENFEGLELNMDFADLLLRHDKCDILVENLNKFVFLDYNKISKQLIDVGRSGLVLNNLHNFKETDLLYLANSLLDSGHEKDLIGHYVKFKGFNKNDEEKIIRRLLHKGYSCDIINGIDNFKCFDDNRKLAGEIFNDCVEEEKWFAENMDILNNKYLPPLDRVFSLAYEIFNSYLTPETYKIIKDIQSGNVDKEKMQALGISQTGEAGINQLKKKINCFKSELLSESFDISVLNKSVLLHQYFRFYVNYESSGFGEHDKSSFDNTILKFEELKKNGKITEMSKRYFPSGQVNVNKVNREKQDNFQYSEQFIARYDTIAKSLKESLAFFEKESPLSLMVKQAENKKQDLLRRLRENVEENANPKARENLDRRIEGLEKLNIRSVKDFQNNFEFLSQFKEFHEDLRQIIFYFVLHKHDSYRNFAKNIDLEDDRKKIPISDVSSMINFVNHVVGEETWKKYFTNSNAVKAFGKIINTKALEEEYIRAQNQESSGKTRLDFVPTRGLLMEFSGHISDACWASKYNSIANEFPNFVSVVIVQNKETKFERLAGASMLIETKDEEGGPLLVIRGLNPTENLINSLDVEDFFEKFIKYAGDIANKSNRKLAIVIDDHSGGASTNRPTLFAYLNNQRNSLSKIGLNSGDDTTFNGYEIVNDCYLVE
ncbi:MAG: hypothetical protein US30_C0008G0028 [Candidatus Moranbacteria bacterium GW2011_GWF2_36_839]|nr:MAG: hypothetical protein US27_C0008G0028 [Candidatus Moranbacteria bacterium GW2011_GWF1_36_78]KKQ17010.1 MAG: hypothetical protein US30_C0008G0028 [Candidatus Moranbacteria bacterium GW2011_GWF2_36_839]HAT74022.1 hypothetical protein [Candidatus Moranbacteria bacterium]HBY11186.1 hypothetical protein [Candidatus Moranbacteria bacterium]